MNPESWQNLKKIFHAAVDLSPAERVSFLADACNSDAELRQQVEKLLASHEETGEFLVSPAVLSSRESEYDSFQNNEAESRAGQRIGAYEIVREIGHGGMGTVYLAIRADDQYRKQVAIKLVSRGMDTDVILRRFMMERQILANLEHPNIARLLEGGSTADGLPYFVMEHIEGLPITDYCDQHQLTNVERLKLFREVCSALQYAHQNLIVHRDIKPSNILVTDEGVPKLLDFGIAKLLSPGWSTETGEATASMGRLMTPEYASPEQLRGLSITTASDVYSLGLVLYELLSGRHPYRLLSRRPEEIAELILREEPEKPSSVVSQQVAGGRGNQTDRAEQGVDTKNQSDASTRNPNSEFRNPKSLRGDLDNIVLKALRKEPQRRYVSVQEFSEDIRRHLEGLPVTASPDTFGYRAGKFVQRHKAGALAAAIVVTTLLTATVITAWQARVARAERVKAEQRFNDVRKLANSVVFELHDSIQDLPGSTPSRQLLVSRALEYLDKLAGEAGQEPSLQLELAAAYDKIGDIQGGFGTSHLGQREKAVESYRKALAIREALVSAAPNNTDFRRGLATSYTKLGEMLWTGLDIKGALEIHGKALAINKTLATELPNDQQMRLDLAKSYQNFGFMHGASGHTEEALDNIRSAVALMEQLAAADAQSAKIQTELARAYDNLALMLTDLASNHSEALMLYRKSQKIGDTLLAADPDNVKLQRGQAVGDYNVAMVSAKLGDMTTGLESSRKALSTFAKMSAADPQNDEFRQGVAMAQMLFCEMLIKTGNATEAIKLLGESLAVLEKSFAASPTDEILHFRIAIIQANLGHGHVALAGDPKTSPSQRETHWREARSWFLKSREILQRFRDDGKLVGDDSAKLDAVNEGLAKCDAALSQPSK